MKRNIKSLIGYSVGGSDGEMGKVKEFYFDDTNWNIRYLIVETGSWFVNKKVLIDPQALLAPDWAHKIVPVNITKEQIKNSPDIDTDQPISNRMEIKMYQHYAWQRYGGGGFYAGGSAAAMNLHPIVDEEIIKENDPANDYTDYNLHLRSTERVSGYYIHATDGDLGHVNDFIIDCDTWIITDLIIDTHNWIGGHKVLIPVGYVNEIQWDNSKILLDVSKDYVKDSEVFDETSFAYRQNIFEL